MEAFWRYGEKIIIREAGEERLSRGFIRTESISSPEKEARLTPMGLADDRRYIILAPAHALSGRAGAEIRSGERVFELLRCEMTGGDHWEGLMRLKGGDGDAG